VLRAERALRRAAENVQAWNRARKLPVIFWQEEKSKEFVEKGAAVYAKA